MFLLNSDIFFWDLLILIMMSCTLCSGIICVLWLKHHPQRTAIKALISFLTFLSFLSFLLITYSSFIEPRLIGITRISVEHKLAQPMTIAVISDLHVGPYSNVSFLQKVVQKINAQLPDMVIMPGDFVYTSTANLEELSPLANIHAPLGVFAVLGNHDIGQYQTLSGKKFAGKNRGDTIAKALTELGVTVLRNTNQIVSLPDGKIAIAGIDDLWIGKHDLAASIRDIPTTIYTILVSHNPSVIDDPLSSAGHLIISGHTHGGQLRFPGIGPLATLPTTLGQEFDQGVFSLSENRTLAITRGIGESTARFRLFAWPEILLITLTPPSI